MNDIVNAALPALDFNSTSEEKYSQRNYKIVEFPVGECKTMCVLSFSQNTESYSIVNRSFGMNITILMLSTTVVYCEKL